jgi:hypothetical protein
MKNKMCRLTGSSTTPLRRLSFHFLKLFILPIWHVYIYYIPLIFYTTSLYVVIFDCIIFCIFLKIIFILSLDEFIRIIISRGNNLVWLILLAANFVYFFLIGGFHKFIRYFLFWHFYYNFIFIILMIVQV